MITANKIDSFQLSGEEYSIVFSQSIDAFKGTWPDRLQCPNLMISYDYLLTIEKAPPKSIRFLYGLLSGSDGEPLAYYYFQYKRFNAHESINYNHAQNLTQKTANALKRTVAVCLDAKGMVFGNLLVTGNHGVLFVDEGLSVDQHWAINGEVLKHALAYSKKNKLRVGFILGKDYESEARNQDQLSWNSVKVQPNMIMEIDPSWDSMTTYLDSMKSKYRKRINSARRKVKDFRFIDVDVDMIEANIDWVYKLYLEIVERAPFNMFILQKQYFIDIKKNLKEACDFTFIYDGDKLVAFEINLSNHDIYEAHFLGYDHSYLKSHDLYLNLLLNTVRHALALKKKTIIFSRTAMQIKSSIGAVPEELYLYLVVQNKILNRLVRTAFKRLDPPVVFNQRHPFKD